jgi:hypothetical protein
MRSFTYEGEEWTASLTGMSSSTSIGSPKKPNIHGVVFSKKQCSNSEPVQGRLKASDLSGVSDEELQRALNAALSGQEEL